LASSTTGSRPGSSPPFEPGPEASARADRSHVRCTTCTSSGCEANTSEPLTVFGADLTSVTALSRSSQRRYSSAASAAAPATGCHGEMRCRTSLPRPADVRCRACVLPRRAVEQQGAGFWSRLGQRGRVVVACPLGAQTHVDSVSAKRSHVGFPKHHGPKRPFPTGRHRTIARRVGRYQSECSAIGRHCCFSPLNLGRQSHGASAALNTDHTFQPCG